MLQAGKSCENLTTQEYAFSRPVTIVRVDTFV
jgi:hypothetical protein